MELTIDNFDVEKIVLGKIEPKKTPTDPPAEYLNVEFKYKDGGKEMPIRLELPMVTIYNGLQEKEFASDAKEGKPRKKDHSAGLTFAVKNPEQTEKMTDQEYQNICSKYAEERSKYGRTVELIMKINAKMRQLIASLKSTHGAKLPGVFKYFKPEETDCSQMKTLLYFGSGYEGDYKYNPEKPTRLYLKLFDYSDMPNTKFPNAPKYKSKFVVPTDKGEEEVEWKILKNVDITCYPLLKIGTCFIGTPGIKPKLYLENCIIVDIEQSKARGRQGETLGKIRQHGGLIDNAQNQVAKLMELTTDLSQDQNDYLKNVENNMMPPHDQQEEYNNDEGSSLNNFMSSAPAEIRTPPKMADSEIPSVAVPTFNKTVTAKPRLNLAKPN